MAVPHHPYSINPVDEISARIREERAQHKFAQRLDEAEKARRAAETDTALTKELAAAQVQALVLRVAELMAEVAALRARVAAAGLE